MSALEPFADQWLVWVVSVSWQLALLVGLAAIVVRVARGASPRLRHALWFLVVLKVFLPPGLAMPWRVGHWVVAPAMEKTGWSRAAESLVTPIAPEHSGVFAAPDEAQEQSVNSDARTLSLSMALLIAWIAGCMFFFGAVAYRYARLVHAIRSARAIDEGPPRVALEQIALELHVHRVPELYATTLATGPFLLGSLRPRIVLPEESLAELDPHELRAVLAHELVHWKRRDTWVGWLQVFAQGILWFHPLLWWANRQLRHERECACDERVLQMGQIAPHSYSESIVRVLTQARGRSLVTGSMVGVFERGSKVQERLENIMNYKPLENGFGWPSRLAVVAFALLFLPMAPSAVDATRADSPDGREAAAAPETRYPRIVASKPKAGAKQVDPALTEISVTFDRDMGGGMSWTGGESLFPPIDKTRKARWTDKRTCVLPVRLEEGHYYRLGINSSSFRNFRSRAGVPVPPSAIYFCTRGATAAIERRLRVPKIVKIDPANGATNVDPSARVLRVTFDMPMGEGMSWTGGGATFPSSPAGMTAAWSKNGLTCTLPVTLEPNHDYRIGLNSLSHINFQSKWGVPLEPVPYTFHTGGAK